jgi:hypothetical protein
MTTLLLTRRYLNDYARNPVNLLLLAIVPTVFVVVVAGSLADAAKLLDGTGGSAVETATAGWAAAFLVGIAMYFQTSASRETDRRLVIAGLPAGRLVASRLITGLAIAALVSTAAIVALAVRTGIDHPVRVILGTTMFALIYLAIGALVGAIARNPVNGTIILLFVWILDVFLGPAMGSADRPLTRGLPTHFVTLWMVDLPSGHGGDPGDLGWALLWTTGALAGAWLLAARQIRARRQGTRKGSATTARSQTAAALRSTWRDGRRNPALWVLLVVVPLVFILTAEAVTPNDPITVRVDQSGRQVARTLLMPDLHGATMAPIAIASLAAVMGLFVLLDNTHTDARTATAGLRWQRLFAARLAVLVAFTVVALAVSIGTTALIFDATQWPSYIAGNLLIGLTYALIGALLAPIVGRVGGVFLTFLLPFLDVGIVQSPMLHPTPTPLSAWLPGYGGSRLLLDGALTTDFDQGTPLLLGLVWLTCLLAVTAWLYRRSVGGARPHQTMHPSSGAGPVTDSTVRR